MLSETFQSIAAATRKVVSDWRSMILLAVVYAILLAALYSFLIVREASMAQVILTFVLAIAAPLLFFVLQAMIANAVAAERVPASALLRRSLASFWKLILISLPLIALAVLAAYLLGKAQNYLGATVAPEHQTPVAERAREAAKMKIDWKAASVSSVRYLLFGLVLPLAAIHLWLATVRDGLGGALRRLINHLARAFAPQSVLIYIAGFLVFGLLPYFLLFRTIPSSRAWLEFSLFVLRLIVVFALTLFGWVITIRALSLTSNKPLTGPAGEVT